MAWAPEMAWAPAEIFVRGQAQNAGIFLLPNIEKMTNKKDKKHMEKSPQHRENIF